MKNIAKKVASLLLVIGILTLALTSCGGSRDNAESGFSGEFGDVQMKRYGDSD